MKNDKTIILTDEGKEVEAEAPVILSVSRATDIPAFYSEWFFERWKKGYAVWRNPFNQKKSYISFQSVRLIVFWSKNPAPLLSYLPELKKKGIHYYTHFTLNDYEEEKLEPGLPSLAERISTFRQLAEKSGTNRVIWRMDPLLLSEHLTVERLLEKAAFIGDQLKGYTSKMVFSFADILRYRHVQNQLKKTKPAYREFTEDEMSDWASGIQQLNKNWNYDLASCGEKKDLDAYGITHNKCVDDAFIRQLFPQDPKLMLYLGPEEKSLWEKEGAQSNKQFLKDKGQRTTCLCIPSKSIGDYNTCLHQCTYCYANSRSGQIGTNYRKHRENPTNEMLIPE